jgi:hypothetical protein
MRLRILFSSVAMFLLAFVAIAQRGPGAPLTASQVECNRQQLLALSTLLTPDTFHPWSTFLTYRGADSFSLAVVSNQWPSIREGDPVPPERTPEVHLVGTLELAERQLVLNPERPVIDQVSLFRDNASSTLEAAFGASLRVRVTPFDLPGDPSLFMNNVRAAGGRIGGITPGRGPRDAGATGNCDSVFTAEEARIFSILRRIVRFRFVAPFPFDSHGGESFILVYRSEAPDVYRMDVHLTDATLVNTEPSATLTITLSRDVDTGQLLEAEVLLESDAVFEPPFDVFVIPPTFPGREIWQEDGARVTHIHSADPGPQPRIIDLRALLEGSTWNP